MKALLAAACVALAGFAAAAPGGAATATDGGGADGAPAPPAGEEPTVAKPDETAADEAQDAAEVFVPSEAISEDIAVPFPVDI